MAWAEGNTLHLHLPQATTSFGPARLIQASRERIHGPVFYLYIYIYEVPLLPQTWRRQGAWKINFIFVAPFVRRNVTALGDFLDRFLKFWVRAQLIRSGSKVVKLISIFLQLHQVLVYHPVLVFLLEAAQFPLQMGCWLGLARTFQWVLVMTGTRLTHVALEPTWKCTDSA